MREERNISGVVATSFQLEILYLARARNSRTPIIAAINFYAALDKPVDRANFRPYCNCARLRGERTSRATNSKIVPRRLFVSPAAREFALSSPRRQFSRLVTSNEKSNDTVTSRWESVAFAPFCTRHVRVMMNPRFRKQEHTIRLFRKRRGSK